MPPPRDMIHTAGGTRVFPLFASGSCCWLMWWLLFPSSLLGHGCEFLSARLSLLENNSVIELLITADYSGNPLLTDAEAARQALHEVLHIEHQGKTKRLSELASLDIQPSSDWQGALPASLIPPPDGLTHQLLRARWRWQPDVSEVRFSIPQGCVHDVLLWQQEPGQETRSTLLITGDVSPVIPIQRQAGWPSWSWLWLALLPVALVFKVTGRK